jgi:hypothetical protein
MGFNAARRIRSSIFLQERQKINYIVNLVDPVQMVFSYLQIPFADRINRITRIFLSFRKKLRKGKNILIIR